MKGKLIVIEGIDGAGTEAQSKLVLDFLKERGTPCERVCYPDYGEPVGRLLHEYLHRKFELSNETLVLLHLADRVKDRERMTRWLEEGKTVIADRYVTSTIAYQGFAGFPVDNIISIADMFAMPRPDAVVYLRVSAETSMERKRKEKQDNVDRNEENRGLMENMSGYYEKLAKENVYAKWVIVDGEKSKQQVLESIVKVLDL